jgi:hypothetical protein
MASLPKLTGVKRRDFAPVAAEMIPHFAVISYMTQINYASSGPAYTTAIDETEHRFIDGTRLCEDSPSLKI